MPLVGRVYPMTRTILAVLCLVLAAAHFTGSMQSIVHWWVDLGLEPRQALYIMVLPLSCVVTWVVFKN